MEKLYKYFSKCFLSFLSLIKILLRSNIFIKKVRLDKEDVFILGNGPSIKNVFKENTDFLKEKTTICVNKFPDTELYEIIKPDIYVIASKGYFNDDAIDYNVEVRKKIINSLVKRTKWPLLFFLPNSAKKNKAFVQKIKSNKHIKIVYFNMTPVEGLPFLNHLFYKLGLGSPRPHNVLIPSILNAINSGFKKIYLLGADHSWLPQISVNDNNQVMVNQKHFYDEESATPKQMHKNEGQGNRALHEVLEKFMLSFRSYHELESYAISKQCKIYNATPNSFVDAFERISLDDLIQIND